MVWGFNGGLGCRVRRFFFRLWALHGDRARACRAKTGFRTFTAPFSSILRGFNPQGSMYSTSIYFGPKVPI